MDSFHGPHHSHIVWLLFCCASSLQMFQTSFIGAPTEDVTSSSSSLIIRYAFPGTNGPRRDSRRGETPASRQSSLLFSSSSLFLECAFTPPRINGATHGNEPGFVTVAAPVQCPYVLECFASHSGTGRLHFWTRLSRCLCDAPDELSKHPWKNFCGLPSPQRTPYRSRSQTLAPRALPWTPRATERLPNCPEL